MKKLVTIFRNLVPTFALAAACLAVPAVHAQLVTNVFSFQKGNLTINGTAYGSGAAYSGVVDGRITDNTASSALSTAITATIGNQYQAAAGTNGQQHVGLFSYDLTELSSYIAANTSVSSTVTVAAVSMTVVAASAATGGGQAISLFGTDPFTSSATWSTTDGSTLWTVPFQNLGAPTNAAQYCYTGGGSALTASLGGSNPLTTVGAGNNLTWSNSANFISAVTNALARADKKLYLTARVNFLSNGDARLNINTSVTNVVASRPQLQITVVVNGTPPVSSNISWVGNLSGTWDTTTANWNNGVSAVAYADGQNVTFDDTLSTSPLNNNITLSSTYSPSNVIANNSTYNYSLTGGSLAGNMNLIKQGTGTFSLGMSNSYTGITTISGGTLQINNAGALGTTAGGTVVASGASLALSNGVALSGEPLTLNGNGNSGNNGALRSVDAVNPVTVACPITLGSNTRVAGGPSGSQLIFSPTPVTDNGSNYTLFVNATATAQVLFDSASNSVGNLQVYGQGISFGTNNTFPSASLSVGLGLFDLNGTTQTFAGLGQGTTPNSGVITNSSATAATLSINYSATNSASFASAISGSVNVVKNGTGTQIFGGGNNVHHTYSGTTTVNAGILALSSDLSGATGGFIVNSGGTLRGSVTIGGSVTNYGLYYPGSASNNLGTATINGNFTFEPGSTMIACINPDLSPSNSVVNVGGTLTYGGTLVIYSIGHTNALAAGETFRIFPSGGLGSFSATNFNSIETQPGTTVSFNDGLVTVTGTAAPTLNIAPQSGGVMQVNWSSSFYKLQWQTNSLSTGLGNNWTDYFASNPNGLASATVTNNPTIPCTFFRVAPKP